MRNLMFLFAFLSLSSAFANPIDCYQATPSSLGLEHSIRLCAGARSTAPADCYNAAPSSLGLELSVQLCGETNFRKPHSSISN